MKKIAFLSIVFLIITACNNAAIPKPDKLIEENIMVDIYYDLSLLEAAKSRNPYAPQNQSINPKEFIYKKYAIDSLQFAQSNQYYVSKIDQCKKMYEKVKQRLESNKKSIDSIVRITSGGAVVHPVTPETDIPQVQ